MTAPAPAIVDVGSLIVTTPGVNGGKPRCAEGGVSVHQLAVMHNEGMGVDEIIHEHFPHLEFAEVYAALAHYFANKVRIDAELDEEERLYEELRHKYPGGLKGPEPDESLATQNGRTDVAASE